MTSINLAAYVPASQPNASSRGWLTGLGLRAVRWALNAQQRHGDWTRLNGMDDHMLKDIGLHRDQIDDVVRGSAAVQWPLIRTAGY
ncbi:DUF1127 domain-containing protein [Rubellimicrobium mesophilum]|uniref:DUF1127 domain-containing protein n=1 Tax=Rubellimicrobium mesophilum TaxID=1123067 RepID=UPI00055D1E04|nr:DUF1127 domain-containing protein [Rubellimicrobium mesophilum]